MNKLLTAKYTSCMVLSMAKIDILIKRRKKLKLSQEKAGGLIGLTQASYSRIETGVITPTPEICAKIERELGVPRIKLRPDIFGDVNA